MSDTYLLIVNLRSRQAGQRLDEVERAFKERGASLEILAVKNPSEMNQAFEKAMKLDPKVIVLGGGDGTLVSGIEYLAKHGYKKPIGILPLGTANYLVRNLDIPLDIPGAVDRVIAGNFTPVPMGVANDKFFALTFIMGLTQRVASEVSDKLKQRYGQIAYVLELIKQTKDHKAFKYEITSPDLSHKLKGRTHQVIVYNSDINLQLKLVPDHTLQKRSLKVVISRCGKSKLKLYAGFLLHIATFGKLRPYMHVFETTELTVKTLPDLPADFDGETFGKGAFTVSLYERDIDIIC